MFNYAEAYFPKSIDVQITDEMIYEYAVVSGDYNQIHLSDKVARHAGFQNRVTHGMLTMAISTRLVSPLLKREKSIMIQSFNTKFLSPLYVKDILSIRGFVLSYIDDRACIKIVGKNQLDQTIIVGKMMLKQTKIGG